MKLVLANDDNAQARLGGLAGCDVCLAGSLSVCLNN